MIVEDGSSERVLAHDRRAQGPWSDLALHTIGWRAFQDLCSQVCEVVLGRPVEVFREAQDGGQDAVFLVTSGSDAPPIGTVQCKHTSDAGKALRIGDLSSEIENVEKLVKAGQADTYAFMTNMSVDAPVAAAMRKRLRDVGVRKPHILGRQYIVRAIRSSARLRALVPQVYGLGDLTSIVDERLSEQSRALLDSWVPKLRTYVPTTAHRDAVNAISNHGVVLLLGNPSSGKSAIGAIVSTIATENPDNTVLALTSPAILRRDGIRTTPAASSGLTTLLVQTYCARTTFKIGLPLFRSSARRSIMVTVFSSLRASTSMKRLGGGSVSATSRSLLTGALSWMWAT